MVTFLLALQTAAAPAPQALVPMDFDLADARPAARERPGLSVSQRCTSEDPTEILVCGVRRNDSAFPTDEMERSFAPRRIVAEASLGGSVTGRVHLQQGTLARGEVSNRVMVGIRLPF